MPLGRPAITEPNAFQLRAVQQVIANIRERFRVSDDAITAAQTDATNALTLTTISDRQLRALLDALTLRVRALERATSDPGDIAVTFDFTAAEAIAVGSPVWISGNNTVSLIDPDDPVSFSGYIGIATQTVPAGSAVAVAILGEVEIPGSSFEIGRALYATYGGVTHDPVGDCLPVGVATDTETMSVGSGTLALRYPSAYDVRDDYLPITYALAKEMVAESTGGVLPVVTGEVPPVFVYLDDGSLVYSPVG